MLNNEDKCINETIGRKLQTLRLRKGLSQRSLADLLGITSQQVQKYEKGSNKISIDKLKKLSKIFDMPIEEFIVESSSSSDKCNDVVAVSNLDYQDYLADKSMLDLIKYFQKIPKNYQNHFLQLIKFLADRS